jgi:uncharacterized protein involved in exopolysaccharide biosynthesis
VTEETLSTTHEELKRQFVAATADTEAAHAGIQAAASRLAQINPQTDRLLVALTLSRSKIEKADRDFKLASDAYESASHDYRSASVTVTQNLKQVSPALTPEHPVRPDTLLNTILAGLLGLALLSGVALARESFREMRPEPIRIIREEDSVNVHHS